MLLVFKLPVPPGTLDLFIPGNARTEVTARVVYLLFVLCF